MIGYEFSKKRETINRDNLLEYIAPQDLRSFGLIPEIVGRFPVVTHLKPLDRASLRSILTEPRNALVKQYIRLFELDGISLSFDEKALDFIVDKAIEFRLAPGAYVLSWRRS
jgi:ATP-dependent Clp protease ATP-binding subunit ClpX